MDKPNDLSPDEAKTEDALHDLKGLAGDKDKEIAFLKRRLGALSGYHLECCEMVARALMYAAEARRKPTILIVRGGGYGDNLQACFVAESLRTLYDDAYIILVIRWDAGLTKMMMSAAKKSGRRLLVDGWCCAGGEIHHPWFFTAFAGAPDIYVDLLYAPRIVFGDPRNIACPPDADDDIKTATEKKRRNMERHKTIFEERWKRDEWLRSIHERSPMSGRDSIKMRKNVLRYQFDVMGLPYTDKVVLEPPDIAIKMQATGMAPGSYVTFSAGAGGNAIRKEYPLNRGPVGRNDEGSWLDILKYIHKLGLKIVQLGMQGEPAMPPVYGLNLIGQTKDIAEPTAWIKHARFHIGIEGGLVHYARCVDTPAIVIHGPTGKTAFGYADNINVGHERCFDCFWRTERWYSDPCPLEHPTCVNFPDTREVQAAISEMMARTKEKRKGED